jgi:RNA recognition motif-containing protein
MNIYVGNLSTETTEEDLRQAFEAFGQVISVKILRDRVTGESNGFGFVGMSVSDEGQTAISELNGKNLKGHAMKVEEGQRETNHRSDEDKQDGFGGDRNRRDNFGRGGRSGRRY